MTTWHWVRHGPTHQTAFTGWRDVPADLSDKPRLARLDAALPTHALLVSSDLLRATATADALAPRTRLPHAPALREFHFGLWDGKSFDEAANDHPELSRAFWEDPGDVAPPEGESWNHLAARVAAYVTEMNKRHADAHIIAVAHFGTILTQVQQARGITPHEALAQEIAPLSITELYHEDGHWQSRRINHLP